MKIELKYEEISSLQQMWNGKWQWAYEQTRVDHRELIAYLVKRFPGTVRSALEKHRAEIKK